jgi:membrane protein implicated in regulation of membrane protease activity
VTGGQIAALIFAILLLLPGGCFLFVGAAFMTDDDRIAQSAAPVALIVAAVLLGIAGLLFWVAFRRRRNPGAPPASPWTDGAAMSNRPLGADQ